VDETVERTIMASTWPLAEGEVKHYQRDGWLVVEGVLSARKLAEVDVALQEIRDAALDDVDAATYIEFEPAQTMGPPAVRRILDPYARHEVFRSVAHDPCVVDRVASLLGSDLDLQHSKLNWKPARVGSPVDWHQDLAYYPHTNDGVMAVLIYLDDASEDNGCLQVLPGHQHHYLDHTAPGAAFAGRIIDRSVTEEMPRPLPAPRGSAIFLHGLTPHASLPNKSATARRTLILAYRAGDAYPLYYGAVTVEDEAEFRPVRGQRAHYARFGGPSPIVPRIDATSSLYEIQAAGDD
jgi:phytanoyl-CoA hydroxylase